jgi:putative tricarboxylic transport membrane protein
MKLGVNQYMKKISNVISYVFIGISIYIFIEAGTFPEGMAGAPGPGFFPRVLATIVGFLSVLQLITSRKVVEDEASASVKLFCKENAKVWISLGFIIVYFIGLLTLGFAISTFMYLFIMIRYYKIKNKIILISVPAGVTAVLFTVFTVLLDVQLPSGILF